MYVAALLLLPSLMVEGFMSAGLWANAETSTMIQTGTEMGTPSVEGGADAPATPAEVKGSMTVQQVVDAFPPIAAPQILDKLGAPLDTPTSTQLKTLVEKGNSIDIPTLRSWLEELAAK